MTATAPLRPAPDRSQSPVRLALIPPAPRGVRYRPGSASALPTRNLWVYGLAGVVAPFVAIKLIDVALVQFIPGI